MQISSRPVRHGGKAFALTITIIFLAVALMIFGSIMYWVAGNAKITERNNQYNMSSGAAEAAVERVLAQMDRDFLSQSLTTATYYASLTPGQTGWPIQYNFSDPTGVSSNGINVVLGPPSTNTVALNSQFTGLYGLAQSCTVSAKATPVNVSGVSAYNVPATVTEQVQFASIPLFQFAIFYNINLEMCPGQGMMVTGPVFCNQSIWEGSDSLTNQSTVSAVGTNCTAASDPFATSYTPHSGTPSANFLLSGQPTSKNDPITMPIGTNNNPNAIQAILAMPPASYALGTTPAYSTNGQVYLANAADLFITNTASGTNSAAPAGTNTFVYYQDGSGSPTLKLVTPDFYILKKTAPTGFYTNSVVTNVTASVDCYTNVQYAGYSFLTNVAFYDFRESATVQALQIDVAKFNLWVTNNATNGGNYFYNQQCITHKGHPIDSIYAYNGTTFSSTLLPAVRVANGTNLPDAHGFTVATPFPMYIYGNYNTHDGGGSATGVNSPSVSYHAWPAALMADAITVLSPAWSDSYSLTHTGDTTPNNRNPTTTTVNAAMLEGIVPTNPNISANYSGGVENFLRLLEDWQGAGVQLWYNGSIVVMFPSQYATNLWQSPSSSGSAGFYSAPGRKWAFDTNFKQESGLPPLTPQSKTLIRGQWMAQ